MQYEDSPVESAIFCPAEEFKLLSAIYYIYNCYNRSWCPCCRVGAMVKCPQPLPTFGKSLLRGES